MAKRKRKFNWAELSSEEEEEVKPKRTTRQDAKEENDKPTKLNTKETKSPNKTKKETASPTTVTSTRSTRTSIKREMEDDENLNSKSKILKSSTKQITKAAKRELEDDSDDQIRSKVLKSSPTNLNVKKEKVTPKKEIKQEIKSFENIEESNILTKSNETTNENEDIDSKYSDLPAISVKAVKIKLNKQDSAKKFNKKHPSPVKSKAQSLITKFKEIKIELSDEQRKWFNEQVQKYDGNYDKEFDKEYV